MVRRGGEERRKEEGRRDGEEGQQSILSVAEKKPVPGLGI